MLTATPVYDTVEWGGYARVQLVVGASRRGEISILECGLEKISLGNILGES